MSTKTKAPDAAEPRGRGRPRPDDVIERDEKVFEALTEPRTKRELATMLGTEPRYVYTSLWRLRRAGRIQRSKSESHDLARVSHVWERVA